MTDWWIPHTADEELQISCSISIDKFMESLDDLVTESYRKTGISYPGIFLLIRELTYSLCNQNFPRHSGTLTPAWFTNLFIQRLPPLEGVLSKFLRSIFGVFCLTLYSIIRIELGQVSLEACPWYQIICFWLKLKLNLVGLTPLILLGSNSSG